MESSGLALYIGGALLVMMGIAGLIWLGSGIHRLLHGRFFNGPGRMLVGMVLLLLVALVGMLGLELHTYFAFTHEQMVATVRFNTIGPQYFHAVLTDAGGHVTQANLHGDEWQVDARIIKWQGFATLLGLQTRYRLDRLNGRYRNLQQERDAVHSAVSLASASWYGNWSLLQHCARWLPWMDASYGSATFLPMVDGGVFQVSLSSSGLIARPENEAARQAVASW
ncbi:MAG: cation/multidrug efflux pump [Gammaproteobacteria bacterium]|nr:cation/multidrug efflux pump [Gammaproteobacteria bacterium]MDE2346847.1 cation/multidrug efflux pump [Gammaproteobacteria bacterium]